MNEIEKMRSGLLADFTSPEIQSSFYHCKKLLAKFRAMTLYDDDYRKVLEDLVPGIPATSVIQPPFSVITDMAYVWGNMYSSMPDVRFLTGLTLR